MKGYECDCEAMFVGPEGLQFCPYCGSSLLAFDLPPNIFKPVLVWMPPNLSRVSAILQGECREENP